MPTAPPRTLDQRHAALAEANRVRLHRAAVRQDLKMRRKRLRDVLGDPDMATAKVRAVLAQLPGIGDVKADRIMVHCQIAPGKSCGGLTDRQRDVLLVLIP